MTRTEEAIFNNKLMALLTGRGESDIDDKEFFERLLYANSCIAQCLLTFNDIYDESDTDVKEETNVKEETPVPPYYVASANIGRTCVSLGFYSSEEKAQASVVKYENMLNSSKSYDDWEDFIHDYCNDETRITDYDISMEYLDVD